MIRLTALLCCIGLICAGPAFRHDEKVVGGTEAKPHSWKYQVSLQMYGDNEKYYHICGGSLIDSFYVLTAAHCVSVDGKYRVVLGEHDLYKDDGTEQMVNVEKVIIHPDWTEDLSIGNDIALLKLADGVYDNGFVELANLPYVEQILPHDFTCYITGWGRLGGDAFPDRLQEAPLKVVEHSICSQPEWWGSIVQESMVCVGGDGVLAGCNGDSGGPLSCKTEEGDDAVWRVHGVASFVPAGQCNMVNKPTVYTRVSHFMHWIYDTMTPPEPPVED